MNLDIKVLRSICGYREDVIGKLKQRYAAKC
jgi:hypothetical protein